MKKSKIASIIVLILVILEIIGITFIYKKHNKKETVLDNVKLNEVEDAKGVALLIEQNDGTFQESTDSDWPTEGYKFSNRLSGCVDADGETVEDALTYINGTVKLKTKSNTSCFLYFYQAKNLNEVCNSYESIDECEKNEDLERVKDIWYSTLEGDGYRFVGTNPDNYICFGSANTERCTSDTDKYMYRIIGSFEDEDGIEHLKLIKKEALNTAKVWHDDYQSNADWNPSYLSSLFTDNSEYQYMQDSAWTDKIETWNYILTNTMSYENNGPNYYYETVQNIYLHEMNRSGKINNAGEWKNLSTKFGLMYVSDYALSLGNSVLSYDISNNAQALKTGWMYLLNNDDLPPSNREWTITRDGVGSDSIYKAYEIDDWGVFNNSALANCSHRPVFYLANDSVIISGTGTSDDPFIIEDTQAPFDNTMVIEEGKEYINKEEVSLTLSSTGAYQMCVSNTAECTEYVPYAENYTHSLSSGDGEKTVYVYFKDDAGNVSEVVTDTIILDTVAPTNNSIVISNGSEYTNSQAVSVALSSTGATQMCISFTESCTTFRAYSTNTSSILPAEDGTHTIYVYFKDDAENVVSVSDTIILDTQAPTCNVTINSNATYTTSANVTLALSTNDATQLCVNNSNSCSSYSSFVTSKSHALTTGDGTKTVYAYCKDAAGNTTVANDTIILDTTKPTTPTMNFVFGDWSVYTDNTWTNKAVCAGRAQGSPGPTGSTDANGIAKYQISMDNKTWEDFNYDISKPLYLMNASGTYYRYFRAVDNAGNVSAVLTRTAKIDMTKPSISAVNRFSNGTAYNGTATNQTVYTDLTLGDGDGSGIKASSLQWKEGSGAWQNTTNTSTTSYQGSWSGERNTTGYYQICDNVGNCNQVSFKIWIDKTAPSKPTIASIYDLWGSQTNVSYQQFSNTSVGTNGTWTTSGNDPFIAITQVPFTGTTAAYMRFSALTKAMSVQTFYRESSGGFSGTYNTAYVNMAAGDTDAYMPFRHTGTWAKYRFDTGTATGLTYKIEALAVEGTSGQSTTDSVYLRLDSSDSSSGIARIEYSTNNSTWYTENTRQSEGHYFTNAINSTQTRYIRACDVAGNCSASNSVSIKSTASYPVLTTSLVNNSTKTVKFSIKSSKAGTYCVTRNSSATDWSCTYTGSLSANTAVTAGGLTGQANQGTWYVKVKDSSGNVSVSDGLTVKTLMCDANYRFGDCLDTAKPAGFNMNANNNMHRFIGAADSVNNYVRLSGGGKNSDFRVIGVMISNDSKTGYDAGSVKLIKRATIQNVVYDTASNDVNWDAAYSNRWLNNTVINNTDIFPSGWSAKFDSVKWYIGDVNEKYTQNANSVAVHEQSFASNSVVKVGLINLSDPFYASTQGGGTGNYDCYTNSCTTWMTEPSSYYWLINRRGWNDYNDSYRGWLWANHGQAYRLSSLIGEYGIRPVVYLLNTVTYQSGWGTSDDPFIIN